MEFLLRECTMVLFHAFSPEVDSGKGDKDEGHQYLPGMYHPSGAVFPRAHLSPELIHYDPQAVESAPDHKFPGGSVPQATQQHRKRQVHVGPNAAEPVSAKRYVQVVAQPCRERDMPATPEVSYVGCSGY